MITTSIGCAVLSVSSLTQTFAQIAPANCKFLGNIVSSNLPTGFGNLWNQVTPENAGKWGSAEPTQDNMSWTDLDLAYNYAKENNLPFKHHAFVWGQQQPSWIDNLATDAEKREEVEEWIKVYSERYPDTDLVDVVNEPLHAPPSYRGALGGSGVTGWDWVIWSFEKAREYLPDAKLILNDYNILNSASATASYLEIINLLHSRGLIDGIGVQAHFLESTSISLIKSNLDMLAATGLPIYVSEYDVNIANDQQQLEKYQEQFPVIWQHPGVYGVTLWGYRQGEIWRTDAYLVRSNGLERPALKWLKQYFQTQGNNFCDNTATGLQESILQQEIKLYPNPATNGEVTLQLTNELYDEVKVYNMNGRVIESVSIKNQNAIKLKLNAAPGIYIMQFSNSKYTVTKRLVVQ
ncbi:glycoside hydrolase [Flammeovirgaceae bacterium 311]|nr:glycoside hydrolase [Flammeovirgaceae bacterium 311]